MDKIIAFLNSIISWLNTNWGWQLEIKHTVAIVFLIVVVILVLIVVWLIITKRKLRKLKKHIIKDDIQVVTKKGKKNIVTKSELKTPSKNGAVIKTSEE
jgi:cell division septal protein FtsQ